MTFSEKIKPLWDKSDMTLEELAAHCNISASTASRYINGKIVPQTDVADKMLALLGAQTVAPERTVVEERGDMRHAMDQLAKLYEDRIQDLTEALKRERIEKWIFFLLLAIVVGFVFLLFYIDLTNGSVGWYRY